MWTLPLGTISNADQDSGVEANMYFDVDFNAYATNSKVSDTDLKSEKQTKKFSVVCKFWSHITSFYGGFRLLMRAQLTNPSLNTQFTKTTTFC